MQQKIRKSENRKLFYITGMTDNGKRRLLGEKSARGFPLSVRGYGEKIEQSKQRTTAAGITSSDCVHNKEAWNRHSGSI